MALYGIGRKKGNIVVVVLILMMVSSFIVLLTMRYVLGMFRGYGALTNYYKSYYMARGGMDLLLTQQSYRGWGYETTVTSGENDFLCHKDGCVLNGSIRARFPRVDISSQPDTTVCTPATALQIDPGQSIIFPLFADQGIAPFFTPIATGFDYVALGKPQTIDMYVYDDPSTGHISMYDSRDGVFGRMSIIKTIPIASSLQGVQIGSALLAGVPVQPGMFILVTNPSGGQPFHFCFSAPDRNMIGLNSIIRSDAQIGDAYVSLETVKTNRFPSILLQ